MTLSMNNVLVFKTNVKTKEDQERLQSLFDLNTSITEWSVDTEDIDCVLRIVSDKISSHMIIEQITSMGYACTELD